MGCAPGGGAPPFDFTLGGYWVLNPVLSPKGPKPPVVGQGGVIPSHPTTLPILFFLMLHTVLPLLSQEAVSPIWPGR